MAVLSISAWPPALPALTVLRTYKNRDTGKRKKREVVSSYAFSDFIQLGAALVALRDEIVLRLGLDEDDDDEDDCDCPLLSEAQVAEAEAAAAWPTEAPQDPSLQEVLSVFTAFMRHLERYNKLLLAALEREDVSWVRDRSTELDDRIDSIEEILTDWRASDKRRFAELLMDEYDFISKLEFDDVPE